MVILCFKGGGIIERGESGMFLFATMLQPCMVCMSGSRFLNSVPLYAHRLFVSRYNSLAWEGMKI